MSLLTRLFSEPLLIARTYVPALVHSLQVQQALAGTKAAVIYPTANTSAEPCTDYPDLVRIGSTGVIPICGPILKNPDRDDLECGCCDIDNVRFMAEVAAADPTIERVLLKVNSPGGTYTGLPECAYQLSELAQAKPLYGFTDAQANSAAYWLLSQAEEIFVTESAVLGSIGCYSLYQDVSAMLEASGIKINAISVGDLKLAGQPFKPMTDEERAYFQALTDDIGEKFHEAVNNRRVIAAEAMQGQVFNAEGAIQNNLAEAMVNSFEELIGLLATGAIP